MWTHPSDPFMLSFGTWNRHITQLNFCFHLIVQRTLYCLCVSSVYGLKSANKWQKRRICSIAQFDWSKKNRCDWFAFGSNDSWTWTKAIEILEHRFLWHFIFIAQTHTHTHATAFVILCYTRFCFDACEPFFHSCCVHRRNFAQILIDFFFHSVLNP